MNKKLLLFNKELDELKKILPKKVRPINNEEIKKLDKKNKGDINGK